MTLRNDSLPCIAPLFVPADRPDRYDKADRSGADAVIIDLEDAVAPAAKDIARSHLHQALELQNPTYIRVNAEGSDWHDADLAAVGRLGLHLICLPKAESAATIDSIVQTLGPGVDIIAIIETARGVEAAASLAAHPSVSRLAFGPADFFLDMGLAASDVLTGHVLMRLAVVSRAAGKGLPLDGPSFEVADSAKLLADCDRAAAHGAGGKLCIHPVQPSQVIAAFRPSAQELSWAQRIVEAGQDGAARLVDGQMIDAPIVARARAILVRNQSHRN